MSRTTRKFIALFLLLWLPLSSGSALAASIAMQLQPGSCHQSAAMSQHGMSGHQTVHNDPVMHDTPDSSCASCSVCHLACSGFTPVPSHFASLVATTGQLVTFIPEIFVSQISAPLVPPPLARV